MPAYRSEAEFEIRQAVVERLRKTRPASRIIHEINACDFGNRIDVLAVGYDEIIAVEIKSEKDKLDRLPAQIKAMRGVAHHTIAALHEKFLVPSRWNENKLDAPKEAKGSIVWAYPEKEAGRSYGCKLWTDIPVARDRPVPGEAIHILWRAELYDLCGALRVSVGKRANMSEMVRALRWYCTGRELTLGICAALRRRICVEADPEILEAAE